MKTYRFVLTQKSPMLHSRDNIEWSDRMKLWQQDADNKKLSIPGDDRSPAFTWLGRLYHDGKHATLPSENLMSCLMLGGAQKLVPGGKHGKTFKAQTQSGMMVMEEHLQIIVNGKPIGVEKILALSCVNDFQRHQDAVQAAGFLLDIRRAKPKSSNGKHVRVRPRFEGWSVAGTIGVWDEQLTLPVLQDIFRISGDLKGVGDWRPSAPKPGPWGRFDAAVEEIRS
jgi:hypothetical protein